MSSSDNPSKTIALPTFSGDDKDYAVYWPRFKAYATLKGFNEVLENGGNLPADPTVLSIDPDVRKNKKTQL